jgi:hypothetical protein
VLRNTDHSGTKAQLRSQLQIVFEATRQTGGGFDRHGSASRLHLRPDFHRPSSIPEKWSANTTRSSASSVTVQKKATVRSSLCALIFLIGKLPRTPGADDGVRANSLKR